MKKLTTHSKNSLFLMEMIFVLLFLSLSCTACIRIFATARENHIKSQELRHIQVLTTTIGELMEGSNGNADLYLNSLPGGVQDNDSISWYYDSDWTGCSEKQAVYEMLLNFSSTASLQEGMLNFYRLDSPASDNSQHNDARTQIYTIRFSFPICTTAKEAVS